MDSVSYKTLNANKQTVKTEWYLVDAEGQTLGRLASQIVNYLRGKHKTDFTPHVLMGTHVVVINAEKVRLTGKKMTEKIYLHHTGYPGGQRERTPKQILAKKPTELLEIAIRKMLPKNKLGSRMFSQYLHVYAGTNHPHEAQNPQPLKIKL